MAHGIMNKDNLFLVRNPAWHGIGTIIQEAPNSEEAIKIAHLDWDVIPTNLYYGKTQVGSKKAENLIANVRSDTNEILGIVTDHYKIISNKQAFQFTDALLDQGAKYEVAGSIGNGRTVWMLARMPEWELLGDKMDNYLCFVNSHDGKGAIHICSTQVRCVCQNTINLALSTAKRSWTGRHIGNMENMENKMEEASRSLDMNHRYISALSKKAEILANTKISDTEFQKLVEGLFPMEDSATDRKKTNVEALRTELYTRYADAPDLQKFKKTQWGVINAVSDLVYHMEPQRKSLTYQENRFAQIIDGAKLLDDAMKLLKVKVA